MIFLSLLSYKQILAKQDDAGKAPEGDWLN